MTASSGDSQLLGKQGLEINGISKSFVGQKALDQVDLHVAPGEVHGLLGQNGSGKSTLIKILSGYHVPDPGGRVRVDDRDLPFGNPGESRRLGLRFVHQNLGVIDDLSVLENLALTTGYALRRFRKIDWSRQAEKARSLLGRLGVDVNLTQLVAQCKEVERTAIAIARALGDDETQIRTLVLDEPTTALPTTEVTRLFEIIAEVRRQGVGVVYVSHRLDELDEIAQRVTVLRDGRSQGTYEASTLDRDGLVQLIVGRRVVPEPQQPAARPAPDRTKSDVVLDVVGLTSRDLRRVDLQVRKGEIVGIAGLVGSGRDELLYALFHAIPSDTESLRCNGRELAEPATPRDLIAAGVVLVPGNRRRGSAVFDFTVTENLTMPTLAKYRKANILSKQREVASARHWIEVLEVSPPDGDRRFSTLSGGNQQKVLLGKWLNCDPAVLLLDEPTAGIDVGTRQSIYGLLRRQASAGIACVVSSTDVEDLVAICDRVLVLRDGRLERELVGRDMTEEAMMRSMIGAPLDHGDTGAPATSRNPVSSPAGNGGGT